MPVLSWPSDLPAPLQGALDGTPQNNKIVSKPEIGRPRRRKRFSGQVKYHNCTIKIVKEKLSIFWNFYDQLNSGVDAFTWTHPIYGALTVQFSGEDEPVEAHSKGKLWTISFRLEVLP